MKSSRQVIKISGESGQGVNSIGEVVAKGLKRCGFYSFGYREYPSLIKGGHAFHQIDFSDHPVSAPSRASNVLLCFSRVSFHAYLPTLTVGGQVIHMLDELEITEVEQKFIAEHKIKIYYLEAENIAREIGGRAIMANVVMVGALWKLLGLPIAPIENVVRQQFADKKDLVEANVACLNRGWKSDLGNLSPLTILFEKNNKREDDALLSGNHMLALGSVAAGVRAYFAYPMTPSSSILTYMADVYHETGILVKQLDDEISVAQFAIGANFAGTRALIATSGGGFDLMTETISLAGMTETPFVCILAQRPGPATGLPTWTAAGDLNLAIYAGHGELPRCVVAISDADSAYTLIQKAFNISEVYQIPTIVLTEKQIAESLFQVENLPADIPIERGLVTGASLDKLEAADRYKLTENGISPRWLPGESDATFVANSDEHLADGTLTEDPLLSEQMYAKRLRKLDTLHDALPEPVIIGPKDASVTMVSWGSVKNTICDVMDAWNELHPKDNFNLLLYEYIYPVKLKVLTGLIDKGQPLSLVENNATGQLGGLLSQHSGFQFEEKLLKYDGRPFFVDDIWEYLERRLTK